MSAKLTWNGELTIRKLREAARAAVVGVAHELRGDLVEEYSQPGRGRIRRHRTKRKRGRRMKGALGRGGRASYTDIGKGGGNRASAPGDPPAPDEGHLRRSVRVETNSAPGKEEADVLTPAKQAKRLEFGGAHTDPRTGATIYIAPRPAWRPVLHRNMSKYERIAAEEAARALNGA